MRATLSERPTDTAQAVEYFAIVQPDASNCADVDFRQCGNITANASQLTAALRLVLAHAGPTPAHESSHMHMHMPAHEGRHGRERQPLNEYVLRKQWHWLAFGQRWAVPGTAVVFECVGRLPDGSRPAQPGRPSAGNNSDTVCALIWNAQRPFTGAAG